MTYVKLTPQYNVNLFRSNTYKMKTIIIDMAAT